MTSGGSVGRIVNTTSVQMYGAEVGGGTCKPARRKTVVETRILIFINIEARLISGHSCLEFSARRCIHLVRVAASPAAVLCLHYIEVGRAIACAPVAIAGCRHTRYDYAVWTSGSRRTQHIVACGVRNPRPTQ